VPVRAVNAATAMLVLVHAATADPVPAGHEVRARLEATPIAHSGPRFVLRARLDRDPQAPALVLDGRDPVASMHVDARLVAKTESAACTAPDVIFRDGFELP
jgi:hypothetical protein